MDNLWKTQRQAQKMISNVDNIFVHFYVLCLCLMNESRISISPKQNSSEEKKRRKKTTEHKAHIKDL